MGHTMKVASKKKTSGTITITTDVVGHIASLVHIPVTDEEKEKFGKGFTATLDVVSKLFSLDVTGIAQTNQVTGLENVYREDQVDAKRMFSQKDALKNAPRVHEGYFVVERILED